MELLKTCVRLNLNKNVVNFKFIATYICRPDQPETGALVPTQGSSYIHRVHQVHCPGAPMRRTTTLATLLLVAPLALGGQALGQPLRQSAALNRQHLDAHP